jgi:hypothetical protein
MTAAELVARAHSDYATVERLLTGLEKRGYVELGGYDGPEQRIRLTLEGYDLVNLTESALLSQSRGRRTECPRHASSSCHPGLSSGDHGSNHTRSTLQLKRFGRPHNCGAFLQVRWLGSRQADGREVGRPRS